MDAEGLELVEEELVEDFAGFRLEGVDVALEAGEVFEEGGGFFVEVDALVFAAEEFVVFGGLFDGDVGLLGFAGGGGEGGLGGEAEGFLVFDGDGEYGLLEARFWIVD